MLALETSNEPAHALRSLLGSGCHRLYPPYVLFLLDEHELATDMNRVGIAFLGETEDGATIVQQNGIEGKAQRRGFPHSKGACSDEDVAIPREEGIWINHPGLYVVLRSSFLRRDACSGADQSTLRLYQCHG